MDDLDAEITSIQNQLTLKLKEKEMLVLERSVYEKQIEQARSKYGVVINKHQVQREKLIRKQAKIEEDDEDYKRDSLELKEYEEHFKSKLT